MLNIYESISSKLGNNPGLKSNETNHIQRHWSLSWNGDELQLWSWCGVVMYYRTISSDRNFDAVSVAIVIITKATVFKKWELVAHKPMLVTQVCVFRTAVCLHRSEKWDLQTKQVCLIITFCRYPRLCGCLTKNHSNSTLIASLRTIYKLFFHIIRILDFQSYIFDAIYW